MGILCDFKVSRKDTDNNKKVYLILEDKNMVDYIYRKSQMCRNKIIKVFPYILPQIFKRFSDISLHTFKLKKADP